MNYFTLFDLPLAFELNTNELAIKYRDMQRAVHPDKFAGSSEQEVLIAVQKTAQINDAYQTLKDPLRRAEYLLSMQGLNLNGETSTVKDMQFLMQQMEWREQLQDIRHSEQPEQLIAQLKATFSSYEESVYTVLIPLLAKSDVNTLEQAADLIRKLKFMAKLQDELIRAEDALFD